MRFCEISGRNNFYSSIGRLRPCKEGHIGRCDRQELLVVARIDELKVVKRLARQLDLAKHISNSGQARTNNSHRCLRHRHSLSLRYHIVAIQHDVQSPARCCCIQEYTTVCEHQNMAFVASVIFPSTTPTSIYICARRSSAGAHWQEEETAKDKHVFSHFRPSLLSEY